MAGCRSDHFQTIVGPFSIKSIARSFDLHWEGDIQTDKAIFKNSNYNIKLFRKCRHQDVLVVNTPCCSRGSETPVWLL